MRSVRTQAARATETEAQAEMADTGVRAHLADAAEWEGQP